MKQKGFVLLIIITIIAILGVGGYFIYERFYSVTTKIYSTSAEYGNISFEYPSNYQISVGKAPSFFEDNEVNGQGIDIDKFDINNFDYSQDSRITKEKVQKYYDDLLQGKLPDRSTFISWSLRTSDKIRKTTSGKFFKVSTTFGAYENCDFKFHTLIEIPVNGSIVNILIYGNINKIRNSMINSDLLSSWEGDCKDKSFAEDGTQKFWDLLVGGGGTPEAKEWFNTANRVINSLNF